MEKLTFIKKILDDWVNLPPTKKVSYITGTIIIVLSAIIYFGYVNYENKITKLENEKTQLKNEYTISINSVIARYESALTVEREKTQEATEAHIKYAEKNETEMRNILFYTQEYRDKKVKQ